MLDSNNSLCYNEDKKQTMEGTMFRIICTKTNCLIAYVKQDEVEGMLKSSAYYMAIYEE